MPDYLLDCNHLSAALRKVSPLRDRICQFRRTGHRFTSCYPVLCELEAGIQQTARLEENRRRLTQLLRHIWLWPLDGETARVYGAVYNELRRLGRVLSQVCPTRAYRGNVFRSSARSPSVIASPSRESIRWK